MRFKGLEMYELRLSKLASGSYEIAGKAIYAGAGVVADAVKRNINALPVRNGGFGTPEKKVQGVTAVQNKVLLKASAFRRCRTKMGI